MEDKTQHFECDDCGAEYSIQTEMDLSARVLSDFVVNQ